MRMILFHGREFPEQEPGDALERPTQTVEEAHNERGGWGFNGPELLGVKATYATYGVSTFRIEFENEEYTNAARQLTGWDDWDENQLLVAWTEDLIRTCEEHGFRYYGDWSLVPDATTQERANSIGLNEALSPRYTVEPQYDELGGAHGDETHFVKCEDDEAEHFAVLVEVREIRGGELCVDWELLQDFPTRYDAEQFIRGQMVLDKYLGK